MTFGACFTCTATDDFWSVLYLHCDMARLRCHVWVHGAEAGSELVRGRVVVGAADGAREHAAGQSPVPEPHRCSPPAAPNLSHPLRHPLRSCRALTSGALRQASRMLSQTSSPLSPLLPRVSHAQCALCSLRVCFALTSLHINADSLPRQHRAARPVCLIWGGRQCVVLTRGAGRVRLQGPVRLPRQTQPRA
eukprot:3314044-Rhodomonas_salina.1